ncbi:hypothetical protein MP638_004302 [Amoeboaphelidium occidentale]|nr:hypothetical protein MP638_004302 [Amoeboaphelidium occidentale]
MITVENGNSPIVSQVTSSEDKDGLVSDRALPGRNLKNEMSQTDVAYDPANHFTPEELEAEGEDILIFVIHGTGQQFDKFMNNIQSLRRSTTELMMKFTSTYEVEGVSRLHYIPVEWHMKLHKLVDHQLNLITLPTIPIIRNINNNYLGDIIHYFTKNNGKTITDFCIDAMNQEYQALSKSLKNFKGKVAILAHSLGGVIALDILSHQQWMDHDDRSKSVELPPSDLMPGYTFKRLEFTPTDLFAIGSPIGSVYVMRGQDPHTYRIPSCIRMHNIFHPFDPIAYRLEPLLDPQFAEIEPCTIEHWNGKRFHVDLFSQNYRNIFETFIPDLSVIRTQLMSFASMETLAAFPQFIYARELFAKQINLSVIRTQLMSFASMETLAAFPQFIYARELFAKQISIASQFMSNPTQINPTFRTDTSEDSLVINHEKSTKRRKTTRSSRRIAKALKKSKANEVPKELDQDSNDAVTYEQPSLRNSAEVEESDNSFASILFSSDASNEPIDDDGEKGASKLLSLVEKTGQFATEMAKRLSDAVKFTSQETLGAHHVNALPEELCNSGEQDEILLNESEKHLPSRKRKREDSLPISSTIVSTLPRRLDYVLQVNMLENMSHEYITGLPSHFTYWSHKDLVYFMMKHLIEYQ